MVHLRQVVVLRGDMPCLFEVLACALADYIRGLKVDLGADDGITPPARL